MEKEISPITAIATENNQPELFIYGSFGKRILALIIDGLIIFFATGLLSILISLISNGHDITSQTIHIVLQLALYIMAPIYMVYFLYHYGATPGKMALHLKVISTSPDKPSVGRLILREVIGKFLSRFFGDVGFLWALFDEKRQTWHDHIASTVVINTKAVTKDEYDAWLAKQKSYLPHVLLTTAIFPLLAGLAVYGLSRTPLTPFLMTYFKDVNTIIMIILIFCITSSFIHTLTSILLFNKQTYSPFLKGTPMKVGVGVYIGMQIATFLAIVLISIYGVVLYTKNPYILPVQPQMITPTDTYFNFEQDTSPRMMNKIKPTSSPNIKST